MDEDVEIVLVNGDLVVSGRLRDISASGAGVLVTETAESSFASVNLAQVSFVLPPGTTPLVLDTRIRHRAAARDFVRYGLEFIEGENEEILAFVMRRQRESLRTKSR
jgi:c-di-GMP-binding flagellar brake protein YcgR